MAGGSRDQGATPLGQVAETWIGKRCWFAWRYDFTKATAFMTRAGWRLFGHVLILGPVGIAIVWKSKEPTHGR